MRLPTVGEHSLGAHECVAVFPRLSFHRIVTPLVASNESPVPRRKNPLALAELLSSGLVLRLRRTLVRLMSASTGSQTLPRPSPSRSCCPGFGSLGQVSSASQMPSVSESPPPPAAQLPPWHVSGWLQVSRLLQDVPFGTATAVHVPAGSPQVPTLHWSFRLEQSTGVWAWQVPALHV